MRHLPFAATAAIFIAMTVALPADAAVRACINAVASGPHEAKTEFEAKQRALVAWTIKANAFGKAFAGWRIAVGKTLSCIKTPAGFSCEARGAPCAIQQVPGIPAPLRPNAPSRNKGEIST